MNLEPRSPAQPALYHSVESWAKTLSENLPHLTKPQAYVLGLWSLGMILAHACSLTAVAGLLARALSKSDNSVRQQLREFYKEAPAKRGAARTEIEVQDHFAPLLGWILQRWQSRQLALAIDATHLGQRFIVLSVSVVYRGCAIPVAWKIVRATEKHPWEPEWIALLRHLHRPVGATLLVIVLADRGLYAKWLFAEIVRLGWHPFLRINSGGAFRQQGSSKFLPLKSFVPTVGSEWKGRGTAFKTKRAQLHCTLLARFEEGYQEAWLVLTDLEPECAQAAWYGLRAWIEQGFKIIKRGGWQWQKTRMSDPQRAERLWLAVSVATLWLLSVGGEADLAIAESSFPEALGEIEQQAKRRRSKGRLVSIFRRGWQMIVSAIINQAELVVGYFIPEAWPESASKEPTITCSTEVPVYLLKAELNLEQRVGL